MMIILPVTLALGLLAWILIKRHAVKTRKKALAEKLYNKASINWKPKTRPEIIFDLTHYTYDILVIGGGASGAGCSLDAAIRGLKVALIEAGDFGSQTSSKSTKLLHGGLRYLEKAVCRFSLSQLLMVFEALSERYAVLRIVPYLSHTIQIMVPIYNKRWFPYYWILLKLYDKLSMARSIGRSYLIGKDDAIMSFARIQDKNLAGAMIYHDGMFDDVRTNVMLVATSSFYGATTANYVSLDRFSKETNGRIKYAVCTDILTGKTIRITAKGYISACGAFTDNTRKKGVPGCVDMLSPSIGTHVVYPANYGPADMGLVDTNTADGRMMFMLPWKGQMIAGSTEAKRLSDGQLEPIEKEVEFINKEIESCSKMEVRRSDILSAWAGARPLISNKNAQQSESLVRKFSIGFEGSNFIVLTGGKWTTYRIMAEKCIDKAIKAFSLNPTCECLTEYVKIIGSENYAKDLYYILAKSLNIDLSSAQKLLERYGSRAFRLKAYIDEYPGIISDKYCIREGEIIYITENEFGFTLYDVINNRLGIGFYDVMEAYNIATQVNELIGDQFNWTKKRRKEELKTFYKKIDCLGYRIVSKYSKGLAKG
ncbi:glycerol-3-phosphate dehydrogenase [Pancytospora epiphaga]|nr:glycerol-3-phosphate dehydrogenase [Pancytospora epiphaga]